jgi:hypothetical protein
MTAGYSGTLLIKKLGIKPGNRIAVVRPPFEYARAVGPLPSGVRIVGASARNLNMVHLFATSARALERSLRTAVGRIARDGMIWVSWPKRASRVPTDVTEDVVRRIALPLGLVDVKVCAVDDVWSGLKLVIRRERR